MTTRLATAWMVVLALGCACFGACGNTEGRRIRLSVHARGEGAAHFTTGAGWDVELREARIVLGPLYVLAAARATTRDDVLQRLLSPVAYAHGGHDDYASSAVRAEWLGQQVVDLLAPAATRLGSADGTAGPAATAMLHLEAPASGLMVAADAEPADRVWVRGTAAKDGQVIEFQGGLAIEQDGLADLIEGVAVTQDGAVSPAYPQLDSGGDLLVTVHVGGRAGADGAPCWFDQADFSRLSEPSEGNVRDIDPTSQVHAAWLLSARNARAFRVSYTSAVPTAQGE